MANVKLIDNLTSNSPVEGTPADMDGGRVVIYISADDYGTDGKVVIKTSAENGLAFVTLTDPTTSSGLAEYSDDIVFNLDKLAQSWLIRADFEGITSGTSTNLNVIMGTN